MTTQKKTKVADVVKPLEAAVAAQKETVATMVKASTDAATKGYEQAVAMTKENVEKASTAASKNYDQVASFNQDTMDAVIKANTIFAKGIEDLSKMVLSFNRSTIEAGLVAGRAMAGATNIEQAVEVQSKFVKGTFDAAVAETTKLTEMGTKIANQSVEPLSARAKVAVQAMVKPVAA